jgi:hypothetical protein
MSYTCPRCGSGQNDDPGLCYSCKCDDYLKGKCDSYGNSLVTEISNKELKRLRDIEKKYNKFNSNRTK